MNLKHIKTLESCTLCNSLPLKADVQMKLRIFFNPYHSRFISLLLSLLLSLSLSLSLAIYIYMCVCVCVCVFVCHD